MSNTYTWVFERLEVHTSYENLVDVVHTMHWRCNADNGAGQTATIYDTQACGPIDPTDFTPYPLLTEAEVMSWFTEAVNEAQINAIKAALDQKIADQITPPTLSLAPPWVSV